VSAKEQSADAWELEVLELTNLYRGRFGLAPLRWDSTASRAAAWKAREIPGQYQRRGLLDHNDDRPPRTFGDRMRDCAVSGYPSVGENIALGYGSPSEVMAAWEASPSHANNMRRAWGSMGVGFADGYAWVQVFSGAVGDGDIGDGGTPTPTPSATPSPTVTRPNGSPTPTRPPDVDLCRRPTVGGVWCYVDSVLPGLPWTWRRWTHIDIPGAVWVIWVDPKDNRDVGPFIFCRFGACEELR
jgi:hypothetical protein